jgi:hypothetical protein
MCVPARVEAVQVCVGPKVRKLAVGPNSVNRKEEEEGVHGVAFILMEPVPLKSFALLWHGDTSPWRGISAASAGTPAESARAKRSSYSGPEERFASN